MIQPVSCFTLTCDGREGCDPWQEGAWHFDSAEAVLEYARSNGWLVAGNRTLCPDCARRADCAATGHRFGEWHEREMRGVPYRTRTCEHCDESEYAPSWRELCLLMHAAREIDGEVDTP